MAGVKQGWHRFRVAAHFRAEGHAQAFWPQLHAAAILTPPRTLICDFRFIIYDFRRTSLT